jgi:hypothetical protein
MEREYRMKRLLIALTMLELFVGLDWLTTTDALAANTTWTGGSTTTSNWSDNANWDTPPSPGDNLFFPSDASRLSNTNDFVAGSSFANIAFTGGGYTISGNTINLSGPFHKLV